MTTTKLTFEQTTKATNLVGTEINELEFINHIVWENGETFFNVIHLNGNERLVNVLEIIK